MSHFTTLVVVKDAVHVRDAKGKAEEMLDPYDENIEVAPRFIPYEQHILDYAIENAKKKNEETQQDVVLDDVALLERVMKEWHEDAESEGVLVDGQYGYMSTRNPDSKWDWYCLGGRWSGLLTKKEDATTGERGEPGVMETVYSHDERSVDAIQVKDLDRDDLLENATMIFSILDKNGWKEYGTMGWWAVVTPNVGEEQWRDYVRDYIRNLDDEDWVLLYDLHI